MKIMFQAFLEGVLTKGSADDYRTYINRTFELFGGQNVKKYRHIYECLQDYNRSSRARYCAYLIALLKVEIRDPHSPHDKSTLQKYKSAMTKLSAFIHANTHLPSGKRVFTKVFSDTFTRDELLDNFIFRMETQDRYYPENNHCFPCRLFKTVFEKDPAYRDQYQTLLRNVLGETRFLINAKRDYVTLNQIDRLVVDNGAKVWVGSTVYDVYTDVYKKRAYDSSAMAFAKFLDDLTLDHDAPMKDLVSAAFPSMPELQRVSDAWIAHRKATGLSGSKITTDFHDKAYGGLHVDKALLWNGVEAVYGAVRLTIMEQRYNSGKNDSLSVAPRCGVNVGV